MKFTLSWLKDHLDTDAPLDAITDALTDLGLEVEGVEKPAEALGAFTICRVKHARRHPNADRLQVCDVEIWPDGPAKPSNTVQVVCGAPNARTGLIGVFAAPGVYVPGVDLTLKEGEIRGEASMGMLCSGRELTVSEDHDGILDLPKDAPLGERYVDYIGLDDPVIEIAITPNRPDALGVHGVARDLAARGLGTLKSGAVDPVAGAGAPGRKVTLDAAVKQESDEHGAPCPLFVGRLIENVANGPAPEWMRRRLRAIGVNPKTALVDITNYVSFDRARPLHVFDADKLDGPLKVRLSKAGETIIGLDEVEYAFPDGLTLICDQNGARPVAIAGVMGGLETGCTAETRNVYVESAYFDPARTATAGRALKINSDARYRFERGVDPLFTEPGAEFATRLILEACGGEARPLDIAGKPPKTGKNGYARKLKLDSKRVTSLVGMAISRERQVEILKALGFEIGKGRGKTMSVIAPSWRPDIHGEADLVEEVARVASLTALKAQPLPRPSEGVTRPALTPSQRRVSAARRQLAALGLNEAVNYTFISEAEASLFGGGDAARRLENPIAADKSDMRPSLLPGLLSAAARNQARGFHDLALFEIGATFHGAEPGEQQDVATALRIGANAARDWTGARRPVDLYDAKRDAEALLASLGVAVDKLMLVREAGSWMHPGRSALMKLGPKVTLAEFGELHPKALAALDVKGPAVAMTVFLDALPAPKAKTKARPALATHDLQAVERDFAFVIDERVEAATALRAARGADKKLITDARVFDVFEGAKAVAQFGPGKKSLALSVTLQPTAKTLTDEEIEQVSAAVIESVAKATGGALRQ